MPPRGHGVHHYHFKVYALDTELDAPQGMSKDELLAAMEGRILDGGELVGTYRRKPDRCRTARGKLKKVTTHELLTMCNC
jgi:hypothetical protein